MIYLLLKKESDLTNKTILLVSPLEKIGGKANFTKLLVTVFIKNKTSYYHIDLIRSRSNNKFLRVFEHIFSFFYYKVLFISFLLKHEIDIVQIHKSSYFDFYDLSLFVVISKLFLKKTFVRYGGASFLSFYNNSNWLAKHYINWVIGLYDVFIVQSVYWKNYFRNLYKEENNIFILPNFVDDEIFKITEEKYTNNKIHILFMPATDLRRKGFYLVKDAIYDFLKDNINIVFHIVGPKVKKQIDIDNIEADNIETYEAIYASEKIKLFNMCSIFLLPTYREGFPNALLEAMASGMAVITTNIPQIACLLDDEKEGLLIEPGSVDQFKKKLQLLIDDPDYIREIGLNARRLVEEKYAINNMDSYLRRLYDG